MIGQSVKPVPEIAPTLLRSTKSISCNRQKFAVKCTLVPPTSRPYTSARCVFATSLGVLRNVFGCVLRMIRQQVFVENLDFVVRKIRFGQVRSLLQHHDAKSVLRKFLRDDPAGRARSDDDEIHLIRCLVLRHVERHDCPLPDAGLIGCQPA